MAFLKRMTKKKSTILGLFESSLQAEYGLSPYIADSISHLVNGVSTNSLTRAMRKTLNTMVEEKLLFKVKLKANVIIEYKTGNVTINKNIWHYGLTEKLSSADNVEAERLDTSEPEHTTDEENDTWIDVMIDYDNNVISEEEQFNIDLMIDYDNR